MNSNLYLITGGVHGDESSGIKVVKHLKGHQLSGIDSILCNKKSIKKNIRFCETDLNRSFSVKLPASYEEVLATKLKKVVSKYQYVIDIHNTRARNTTCAIVVNKPTKWQLQMCRHFGFDRLVIMPPSGSLISQCKNGISLEIAENHKSRYSRSFLVKKIRNIHKPIIDKRDICLFEYAAYILKKTLMRKKMKLSDFKNFVFLSLYQKKHLGLLMNKEYCPIFTKKNNVTDGGFTLIQKTGTIS